MKILLVEDTPEYQVYLKKILSEQGYNCRILDSADNILETTEYFGPDLILMDVGLPGVSGFNACSQLKCHPGTSAIPLFFLTCKSDISDKILGFKIENFL